MAYGAANHNGNNFHVVVDGVLSKFYSNTISANTLIDVSEYLDYSFLIRNVGPDTSFQFQLSDGVNGWFDDGDPIPLLSGETIVTKPSFISKFLQIVSSGNLLIVLQAKTI